jgi:hypothetical protein
LGLVTAQKPHPVVPTLREGEPAGITFVVDVDVDVDQQVVMEVAGGDNLHDVALPEARPDGFVSEESTSPRVTEDAMVVAFRLGSGSCLVRFLCANLLISGIYFDARRVVFGSLKVYCIYGF